MKALLNLFIISLFAICQAYAQEAPKVKFGKPALEELQMETYAPDSTANAVILFDEGQSMVNYDTNKSRFMLEFERFVRIKVLKQEGTDWGNFLIPVYSHGSTQEQVMGIDGVTINMEEGKPEKSELKKESIFRERENKYWENVKLSMPQVKVGSIIDLRYTILSPLLWNLRTWKFQYTIPVKWSYYQVSYPEYFNYNQSTLGYHSLCLHDHKTVNENISYTEKYETEGRALQGGGQRKMENRTITYMSNVYSYGAKDVPAMREEPYITTLENYITRIKFELASTDFTKIQGSFKTYTNSWDNIVEQLLTDEDFGGQIKSGNFAEEITPQLIAGKTTEKEKLIAIYDHIQHTIKWDKTNGIYSSKPLRKSYAEKNGNVADINLTLLVMLRQAGIKADPVLLSTRSHGILTPTSPTLSEFNYVIVQAMADNVPMLLDATEIMLLDATEINLPAGTIPFRCLNIEGVLIKKDAPTKVPLINKGSKTNILASLEMSDGKLTGTLRTNVSGVDAFDFRENVKEAGGEKDYFGKIKNNSVEIRYLDYSYTNIDNIYLPVEKNYKFELENSGESDAEILYINPILTARLQKNPFTSPSREYPVDFGSAFLVNYLLNFKIPEGYQVEELPKSKSVTLAENAGSYIYQIAQDAQQITINARFNIGKSLFVPDEYKNLQAFYDMVVAKEAEQIILKKIN